MPRLVRVPRLYARRYMRLYALLEEEEPRILILRRVQQRRGRATYLNLTTCAEKRKKCHVTCEALCQGNIPRFIRVRLYMLRKRKKCHVLTCAKALCQEEE